MVGPYVAPKDDGKEMDFKIGTYIGINTIISIKVLIIIYHTYRPRYVCTCTECRSVDSTLLTYPNTNFSETKMSMMVMVEKEKKEGEKKVV